MKFRPELAEKILAGEKTTTRRLFDDKNLCNGDMLSLLNSETKKEFAIARIINAKETTLGKLSAADWEGHEKFSSAAEMHAVYSNYYNARVDENTAVKIIKFELVIP